MEAPPDAGFCESLDIGLNTMLKIEADAKFAYQQAQAHRDAPLSGTCTQ